MVTKSGLGCMRSGIVLPKRIFFTGVPGSRWSGIAQRLETLEGFNTSDRTPEREFSHSSFSGHKGAYFGQGELSDSLELSNIDSAHENSIGTRIIKSHTWAYSLDEIKQRYPDDWIMLVYRPDQASYDCWHDAGGFDIKYPDYSKYVDSQTMLKEIMKQNRAILEFACSHNATWNYFTEEWIKQHFNQTTRMEQISSDILITIIK